MSDTNRPLPAANEGPTERKGGLPSARPASTPAPPEVSVRDGGDGGGRKRPKSAKPTPVRAVAEATAPPTSPTEPDLDEARIEVDGIEWTVRVLGRSGSPGAGETPLLLLGFEGESPASVPAVRESLIVGRTLKELSDDSLRCAFDGSVEPRVEGAAGRSQSTSKTGRERTPPGAGEGRSSRRGRS